MGRAGLLAVAGIAAVSLFFIYQVFVCDTCGAERTAARLGVTVEELTSMRGQAARERILKKFDDKRLNQPANGVRRLYRWNEWKSGMRDYSEKYLHKVARDLPGHAREQGPGLLLYLEVDDREKTDKRRRYRLFLYVRTRWDGCVRYATGCHGVTVWREGWNTGRYLMRNTDWKWFTGNETYRKQRYATIPMTADRIATLQDALADRKVMVSYGDGEHFLSNRHRKRMRYTLELYNELVGGPPLPAGA